jgi:two-component system OmpR family sensor kinase
MTRWWQRQSLKLRLTLWYAFVTVLVIALFAFVVFEVVEHRLASEIDRQLRIDFDVVEAQLDLDTSGKMRWLVRGAHGDEGFARLSAWFEVWSEDKQLLLRHWPVRDSEIKKPLPAPQEPSLRFATVELEHGLHVRIMERPARVRGQGVVVRVLRDESDMRRTLQEIIEVFLLAAPIAATTAALAGYVLARRSLRPIGAMAAQARNITSESLGQRLPVANPHDELGQLAVVFNETLHRLETSFSELRRFTADASHELRTPLTALRAVGEDALRERDDPAVSSMLEEAQRLEELIASLLALARMEGAKNEVAREPVELDRLVAEVRDMLKVLAAEKQQTIEIICDATLTVPADRVLLRQAVTNVLHNAIRYAPARSSIRISIEYSSESAMIAIADEGPGIAPEHHDKIFDRFYRVDKARSRADGGHGLGLAIAKGAIARQSGRIGIESALGRGSVFRIYLPR